MLTLERVEVTQQTQRLQAHANRAGSLHESREPELLVQDEVVGGSRD